MRAYVFVDDSNDEQATIPHETDTGELRALEKKRVDSIMCIHDRHRSAWRSPWPSIVIRFPTVFLQ
jgi:hypothetical protein